MDDWKLIKNELCTKLATKVQCKDNTVCEQVQSLKTNVIKSSLPDSRCVKVSKHCYLILMCLHDFLLLFIVM